MILFITLSKVSPALQSSQNKSLRKPNKEIQPRKYYFPHDIRFSLDSFHFQPHSPKRTLANNYKKIRSAKQNMPSAVYT